MSDELKPCRKPSRLRHGHARHGMESPTWTSWQAMLARCRYPHRDEAQKYARRGISVCERWQSFDHFLSDMGERPAGTTLDRIDNERGYEPGNCRWSTPREQSRNTRRNRLDFYDAVEVAVLRLSGVSCRAIANQFGISESLPREIVAGRCWPDALDVAKERVTHG